MVGRTVSGLEVTSSTFSAYWSWILSCWEARITCKVGAKLGS